MSLFICRCDRLALPLTPDSTGVAVVWRLNNASVSTIDADGVMTAFGEGETLITASLLGQTATCRVPATCRVRVVDIIMVNHLVNVMLGFAQATEDDDFDGDGAIDISDVNTVINAILGLNAR